MLDLQSVIHHTLILPHRYNAMKLIASRKNPTSPNAATDIPSLLNSGFGVTYKVVEDQDVDQYIEAQALRGNVCFEFSHTGTYQSQTTIIKSQAA